MTDRHHDGAWNDPPAHRNAPPGTSDEAARMAKPRAARDRARILAAIREAGPHGLTDDEGEARLGIIPQTYTPRRGELVKAGLVVASGKRRKTTRGCPAAAWIASEYAEGVTP